MSKLEIFSFIKTACGRSKYQELIKKRGLLNRIRFYWFVFFAIIKDWNLANPENQSE